MKKLFLLLGISIFPFLSQAQITEENVSDILKTLSSDQMKGRKATSASIRSAANFIADTFSEIRLQPIQGEDDFYQRFHIQEITAKPGASLMVDGKRIPAEHFFVISNEHDISWTPDSNIAIKHVAKEDDFRAVLGNYAKTKQNMIVFVDPSHQKLFNQFQPYFSQASRSFPEEAEPFNKVFIMAEPSDNFTIKIDKQIEQIELINVAGMIEGKRKDEIVLFAGHYDHLGIVSPVNGDSIANGANDNASGTTAVIELARYFAHQPKPERTLMFVGFTAEEMGGYGSKYFSRQLDPDNIVAMFNIEMIGKPATDGPNSAWITGFDRSSFGKLLQKSSKGTNYTFYPDPYPQQNLFYRSDNATLARLGVPAHSISTTPIDVDPDYHQVTDEFSTINIPHLTNTIKAIARAAEGIVSGKDTPTRIDKNTVDQ